MNFQPHTEQLTAREREIVMRRSVLLKFLMLPAMVTVALVAGPPIPAQDETDTAQPPCASPRMNEFDFWVGDWSLTWGDSGQGSNSITRDYDGCVIIERFNGSPSIALRGMSVSTVSPETGNWHQTWVDNSGAYLDFVGGLRGERMVLQRDGSRQGKGVKHRMVWYNISDDSLDWNWEQSTDDGQTWNVLWHIYYERKE